MSKESFARGFCKVAAEHGVDPVMLAKCAWDENGVEHDALQKAQQESLKSFRNSMVRNGTPSAKATKTTEGNAAATQMPGGFPPYIKGFADAPKRSAWIMMMKDKIDKAGKKAASLIHVR